MLHQRFKTLQGHESRLQAIELEQEVASVHLDHIAQGMRAGTAGEEGSEHIGKQFLNPAGNCRTVAPVVAVHLNAGQFSRICCHRGEDILQALDQGIAGRVVLQTHLVPAVEGDLVDADPQVLPTATETKRIMP